MSSQELELSGKINAEVILSNTVFQELMDLLPSAFRPERAAGMDAVIQFLLSGENSGNWYVTIHNQTCHVQQGEVVNPSLTLSADSKDALDIMTGKLDGMRAYMQGKVSLKGNFGLALKFSDLFDLTDEIVQKIKGLSN